MTLPRGIKTIRVFCLAVLLYGCNKGPADIYFPLGNNAGWEYAIEYNDRGEQRQQRLLLENLPPVSNGGNEYFPRKSIDGHTDYFQINQDGIVRIDPASGAQTRILQQPYAAGTQWQETMKITVLQITGPFIPTFLERIQTPIDMTYRIAATDDSVMVNGTAYTHCLRVSAAGRMYAGKTLEEFMNITSIHIEVTEWYAPGTGLVKSVLEEFTAPKEFRNTLVRELLSFKPD